MTSDVLMENAFTLPNNMSFSNIVTRHLITCNSLDNQYSSQIDYIFTTGHQSVTTGRVLYLKILEKKRVLENRSYGGLELVTAVYQIKLWFEPRFV